MPEDSDSSEEPDGSKSASNGPNSVENDELTRFGEVQDELQPDPVTPTLSKIDSDPDEIVTMLRSHARTASLCAESLADSIDRGKIDSEVLASARCEHRELGELLADLTQ